MKLSTRQVHLDFHTSEHIPDVGARFNKKQWQKALKLGQVNSITIFAKCHHSWSYYPTAVGAAHPNLKRKDLMGEQIRASHEIGVRAPIYYTVGWSASDAEAHPEWCVREAAGNIRTTNYDLNAKPGDARPACSWKFLCPSGGYKDLMLRQTREICAKYPVDGFFYDICPTERCYCVNCRAGMKAAGLDADNLAEAQTYAIQKWVSFMSGCRAIILGAHPEATVFFNGVVHASSSPVILEQETHFELEDLPTMWGGYDKFPPRARYFLPFGKPLLAMSGKFHTVWGEFGGFKHPDAIRFEAAAMVAYGASCSIGDQLHPSGEMDLGTYGNIGKAYGYVKKIEDFGVGAHPFANLGVYFSDLQTGESRRVPGNERDDNGVCQMLLEGQIDFEVAHVGADWSRFDTLILTGAASLSDTEAKRVNEFIKRGGAVLVLGESALDMERKKLVLDIGGTYLGPADFKEDYLIVGGQLGGGKELVASPFLNYEAGTRVKATKAKVLAKIREPYFNRTYGHYCSHQNTANQLKDAPHAGALQHGRVVYLAHRLGRMYNLHGARVHRDLFLNAVRLLHKNPRLKTTLPSAGRATLVHQPESRRYVVHLLYATPLQRGRVLVIDDLVKLTDIPLEIRVPEKIKRIRLPLTKKSLKFKRHAGRTMFSVSELQCHQLAVAEY